MEDATLSPNAHMALLEGPEKHKPLVLMCYNLIRNFYIVYSRKEEIPKKDIPAL